MKPRGQSQYRHPRRNRRSLRVGNYRKQASKRLSKFRQATRLAVAMAAFVLFLIEAPSSLGAQKELDTAESIGEASGALQELYSNTLILLPKVAIAVLVLLVAWMIFRLFKFGLERVSMNGQKRNGIITLVQLFFIFLGIISALTVLAGDMRALLGSVGLIGLALSWALQQPIESFAGYILNAFRAYYRIGDRINVGEVYGDVYRVDFLTTTVWEVGGPGKSVTGAQSTGALITFPNSELLRSNIVNYTRDFPFIWDEITIGVANGSDLTYTMDVLREVTTGLVGETMKNSVREYQSLLRHRGLEYDIADRPQVYLSGAPAWTNCTIRYLVDLRKRRTWSTQIYEGIVKELGKEIHRDKIISSYPNQVLALKTLKDES